MFKKMTALLLSSTLLMGQMTFAAELSKLEYTKQLVKGLGFQVKSAEEAYNRKTSESEDIIYTAFQMGLLKGVSWDFENPMTEEEREVILGNAMAIHNEANDDQTDGNNETDENTKIEDSEKSSVEEEIWSNEEFEAFMDKRIELFDKWEGWDHYYNTGIFEDGKAYVVDWYSDQEYHGFESKPGYEYISKRLYDIAKPLMWYALENDDYLMMSNDDTTVDMMGAMISYAGSESQYRGSDAFFALKLFGYEKTALDGFKYDAVWSIGNFIDEGEYTIEEWEEFMSGTNNRLTELDEYNAMLPRYVKAFEYATSNAYLTEEQGNAFFDYHVNFFDETYGKAMFKPFIVEIGGIRYHVSKYAGGYLYRFKMTK